MQLEKCLAGMRAQATILSTLGTGALVDDLINMPVTNRERHLRIEDIRRALEAHSAYNQEALRLLRHEKV